MKYVVWLFLAAITLVGSAHSQQLVRNEPMDQPDPLEEFLELHQGTSSQAFDNSSLAGTYAYFGINGGTPPTFQVELCSTMGVWQFDGRGSYTVTRIGHCTVQGNNTLTFGGTYTVRPSGLVTLFISVPGVSPIEAILTDAGAGFVWHDPTTRGLVQTGYARRVR